jgi:hypothetical protein
MDPSKYVRATGEAFSPLLPQTDRPVRFIIKRRDIVAKLSEKDKTKGIKAVEKEVAKAEKEAKLSRNVGVTSGKRIWEYQNDTLLANVKKKLTDAELAADWHTEFPMAMDFTERVGMVQTVRSLFNKGKHKNDVPDVALVAYDEAGKPLAAPTRGRKKAEVEEDEEEEEDTPPPPAKKSKK